MKPVRYALFAVLCVLLGEARADTSKAVLTHETLWMMKRLGAPVVSPDGKWVVYALSEPNYDPDKAVSDLWLVASDGTSAPKRLTNTRAAESGVAFSPDSRRIAFATKREGDEVVVSAAARSFLHHQVRSMVGTLALVGLERWSADDLADALAAADRQRLGHNAPPDGLYFMQAIY